MIDQGGNGNGQQSGINRFAQTTPMMIFGLLQQMQALGLDLPAILSQLGISNPEKLIEAVEEKKSEAETNGKPVKITKEKE
jgi:hypothetical protein